MAAEINWQNATTQNATNAASQSALISNWDSKLNSSSTAKSDTSKGTGATNPNAELDKDAFLKLLLTELEHQDPTDPMDSDKMLTQTSQLSALEMQQNTNKTMQQMVDTMNILSNSMKTGFSVAAVGAIGKMATISDPSFSLSGEGAGVNLSFYLPQESDENGASLEIYNASGKLIAAVPGEKRSLPSGSYSMSWDGKGDDGVYAGNGSYSARLVFNNKNGEKIYSKYGSYPIESVKFQDGKALAKLNGQEVAFDDIGEISN